MSLTFILHPQNKKIILEKAAKTNSLSVYLFLNENNEEILSFLDIFFNIK